MFFAALKLPCKTVITQQLATLVMSAPRLPDCAEIYIHILLMSAATLCNSRQRNALRCVCCACFVSNLFPSPSLAAHARTRTPSSMMMSVVQHTHTFAHSHAHALRPRIKCLWEEKRSNARTHEKKTQNPSSIMVAHVPASAHTHTLLHTRCSNSLHLRVPINNESASTATAARSSVPPFFLGCTANANTSEHDEKTTHTNKKNYTMSNVPAHRQAMECLGREMIRTRVRLCI